MYVLLCKNSLKSLRKDSVTRFWSLASSPSHSKTVFHHGFLRKLLQTKSKLNSKTEWQTCLEKASFKAVTNTFFFLNFLTSQKRFRNWSEHLSIIQVLSFVSVCMLPALYCTASSPSHLNKSPYLKKKSRACE